MKKLSAKKGIALLPVDNLKQTFKVSPFRNHLGSLQNVNICAYNSLK